MASLSSQNASKTKEDICEYHHYNKMKDYLIEENLHKETKVVLKTGVPSKSPIPPHFSPHS